MTSAPRPINPHSTIRDLEREIRIRDRKIESLKRHLAKLEDRLFRALDKLENPDPEPQPTFSQSKDNSGETACLLEPHSNQEQGFLTSFRAGINDIGDYENDSTGFKDDDRHLTSTRKPLCDASTMTGTSQHSVKQPNSNLKARQAYSSASLMLSSEPGMLEVPEIEVNMLLTTKEGSKSTTEKQEAANSPTARPNNIQDLFEYLNTKKYGRTLRPIEEKPAEY
ncbi:MAG: hypothetical protein Q9219_002506 [cf. Caloplaca sp. 3 TL-2023]